MKIPFYKYQGAGNDFIIIDQRLRTYLGLNNQKEISDLCDRRFGIGADGLMFLQNSEKSDFEMVYFNADGNRSSMCGNGGRCIVSLASRLNVFEGPNCIFQAIDGLHEATILLEGLVTLKMNDVTHVQQHNDALILDTGSPHYVKFESDIENIDIISEAHKVRYSEPFKEDGINVNFIETKDNELHIRTYERGVEDETLACGTGVTAAALVAALKNGHSKEGSYDVIARGGKLSVSFQREGNGFKNIWLTGPAVAVFEGYYKFTTI